MNVHGLNELTHPLLGQTEIEGHTYPKRPKEMCHDVNVGISS